MFFCWHWFLLNPHSLADWLLTVGCWPLAICNQLTLPEIWNRVNKEVAYVFALFFQFGICCPVLILLHCFVIIYNLRLARLCWYWFCPALVCIISPCFFFVQGCVIHDLKKVPVKQMLKNVLSNVQKGAALASAMPPGCQLPASSVTELWHCHVCVQAPNHRQWLVLKWKERSPWQLHQWLQPRDVKLSPPVAGEALALRSTDLSNPARKWSRACRLSIRED